MGDCGISLNLQETPMPCDRRRGRLSSRLTQMRQRRRGPLNLDTEHQPAASIRRPVYAAVCTLNAEILTEASRSKRAIQHKHPQPLDKPRVQPLLWSHGLHG